MSEKTVQSARLAKSPAFWLFIALVVIGGAAFVNGLISQHPERAWQAYLINFLLFVFSGHAHDQGSLERTLVGTFRILCRLFPIILCAVFGIVSG
jgi:hypothetical protein